ncbi:mandelate racemase/muconate lactonizing enzyme family protein [Planomicrobium sp. YIM 101495]|uniref:mandelate racemase/muconate lactonizing enzyme family protein n=1 Tax=Planomicrobium sp. YIM 101495 TaxID=2665160 RepID=UPI0012B89346|nr:dipeptide epimerase [Planomicrobium sp. YIM 101495]MTD30904.1 dipeptide epimerase [Planomicrobium sp. YIM 101495]
MKITKATLYAVRFPLKEPFIISYATYPDMPAVILELETDTGLIGFGESVADEHVTGEFFLGAFENLKEVLVPAILGMNPFDIEAIHAKMDSALVRNPAAKAAVDIACFDLMGKATGLPVYQLIGGKTNERLTYPKVLSIESPEIMATKAVQAIEDGYTSLKLKVGADKAQDDVDRIKAVREAVGPAVPIRVDVNQGWKTPGIASAAVRQLEGLDLSWIEQPIRMSDLHGLAEIRTKTAVPIMADESLQTMEDLLEIIRLGAADVINIKLMKCGGIYPAAQLAKTAEAAGLACQVGSMVESSVGSAAGYHTAMARNNIETTELTGPLLFSEEIGDLQYIHPNVLLADKPGLGVTIDRAQLAKLTVKTHIIGGTTV